MKLTHHAHSIRVDVPKTVVIDIDPKKESYDSFFDRFGIDDARELTLQAYIRPQDADEKIFVVRADFITLEAQNALLKLLEEPPVTSRFLFVLPSDLSLLDTLCSRMEALTWEGESTMTPEFAAFLVLEMKDRVAKIDVAMKQKDLEWQRAMKSGLIRHLETVSRIDHYRELEFVARTLLTRGASNKMLLEHAALLL